MSLLPLYNTRGLLEAGCDEAGRGCLAGAVYAAAVVLPPDYYNPSLNDSKQLTVARRYALRREVERDALAWAVGVVSPREIDEINILNASILAMHRALDRLKVRPEFVIVDGNRFHPYRPGATLGSPDLSLLPEPLPHATLVKGDARYLAIAAASILAKTYRDDYMAALHRQHPQYGRATPDIPPASTAPPSPSTAPLLSTAAPSASFRTDLPPPSHQYAALYLKPTAGRPKTR